MRLQEPGRLSHGTADVVAHGGVFGCPGAWSRLTSSYQECSVYRAQFGLKHSNVHRSEFLEAPDLAFVQTPDALASMRHLFLPLFVAASPAIALVAPRSVPALLITIGLAAALAAWTDERHTRRWHGGLSARAAVHGWLTEPVTLAVAGLLAIAWLSKVWSINPGHGATSVARVTGMAIAGLFALAAMSALETRHRHRAIGALACGGVLIVALFVANAVSGGTIFINIRHYMLGSSLAQPDYARLPTRASAILVVILWPLALVAARRFDWRLAFALVAGLGLCMLVLPMRAVVVAYFVGLVAWTVARWGSRRIPFFTGLMLAAAIVVLPPILSQPIPRGLVRDAAYEISDFSAVHRLKIWEFTLSKINERPWLGWGMAASRDLGSAADPKSGTEINVMPLHPHNNALQVWLELGVLGGIFFATLCAVVAWKISYLGHDPAWRACAFATYVIYLTVGGLSYGAAQTWWVATAWLAAVFLAVAYQPAQPSREGERHEGIASS